MQSTYFHFRMNHASRKKADAYVERGIITSMSLVQNEVRGQPQKTLTGRYYDKYNQSLESLGNANG